MRLPAELIRIARGLRVKAICRDPCRRDAGQHRDRSKECLSGCQIAVFAQRDIDQGDVATDRTIQIPAPALHSDVVSSTYRLQPTPPLRLRRRCLVRADVSLASHSRTTS